MGIENAIANLQPKKKKLIENIISVAIIFIIVYAFLTFVTIYQSGGDIFAFLSAGVLMPIIIPLIFLYFFGYKLIKGGKITIPQQPQQKQQYNIPNVWGDTGFKKPQPKQPIQQTKPKLTVPKQPLTGSYQCPNCGTFVIGYQCKKCGYRR